MKNVIAIAGCASFLCLVLPLLSGCGGKEKAPSFMGYELGMMQSDIDEQAVERREDRKPGKEFIASAGNRYSMNNHGMLIGDGPPVAFLDAEKKYPIVDLTLVGNGKNIVKILVMGPVWLDGGDAKMRRRNWMRYATAMVEQKTGRKPDAISEDDEKNYAKWNAKTYEVEIYVFRGDNQIKIEVTAKNEEQYDSKTVKPGI